MLPRYRRLRSVVEEALSASSFASLTRSLAPRRCVVTRNTALWVGTPVLGVARRARALPAFGQCRNFRGWLRFIRCLPNRSAGGVLEYDRHAYGGVPTCWRSELCGRDRRKQTRDRAAVDAADLRRDGLDLARAAELEREVGAAFSIRLALEPTRKALMQRGMQPRNHELGADHGFLRQCPACWIGRSLGERREHARRRARRGFRLCSQGFRRARHALLALPGIHGRVERPDRGIRIVCGRLRRPQLSRGDPSRYDGERRRRLRASKLRPTRTG
jgi:hypothetical protein